MSCNELKLELRDAIRTLFADPVTYMDKIMLLLAV